MQQSSGAVSHIPLPLSCLCACVHVTVSCEPQAQAVQQQSAPKRDVSTVNSLYLLMHGYLQEYWN